MVMKLRLEAELGTTKESEEPSESQPPQGHVVLSKNQNQVMILNTSGIKENKE